MVIQELKPSARRQGRWLAVLEDGSILRVGEGEVIDFALCAGKELSPDEAEALLAAAKSAEYRAKALDLLSRRPQSRKELTQKLGQWGAEDEEAEAICDRMEQLGYLNDQTYAAQVVRHYAAKGFGEKKLRDELYRRGLPRQLWAEALEQVGDPAEAIFQFAQKKLGDSQPDRKQLQKVAEALGRRGYAWADISDVLRRWETGDESYD